MGMGAVAACWGTMLALRFRTQSAAPLMQAGMFAARPHHDRLRAARLCSRAGCTRSPKYNPVTQVLEAARQGFVGGVTWSDTWPGLLGLAGLLALLGALALRGMRRTAV